MPAKTVKVPIIAVLGHKSSGKTTVIENIVRRLTKKGYKVATAKHVALKGFSLDTKGKNTWRHSAAGANPVVSISDEEIAILIKKGEERFSLDQLLKFMSDVDIIVLEGFSRIVLDDDNIGKIFCVKNLQEYKYFHEKVKGEVIAFCSLHYVKDKILNITEDSNIYVKLVLAYIDRKIGGNKNSQ